MPLRFFQFCSLLTLQHIYFILNRDFHLKYYKEKYRNGELSSKYGVPVYDFSHLDYCLLGHVKSNSETTENLVKGIALSIISKFWRIWF